MLKLVKHTSNAKESKQIVPDQTAPSCTPAKDIRFYPWIENLLLPMRSYPGRQVTSSCEIAS